MSDHYDELVSAYLDGEATPEEVAQVEGDPSLLGRVRAFEQVRLTRLPPVVPSGDVKEQHLAAALAEFDSLAPVHQLSARSRPDRRVRWLSSVAAGALVIVGVGVAVRQGDSGRDASGVASGAVESDADLAEAATSRASDGAVAIDGAEDELTDAVEESEEEAAADEDTGGALDLDAARAPLLTFPDTPDASVALAEAVEKMLVPASPDGSAFDARGCGEGLIPGEVPTAVVDVEAGDELLVLYVFGEADSYRAYLVAPPCEVVDRTP